MESLESGRQFSKKHDGTPWRLFFSTTCALVGPLSFGYVIGYSSPAIPQLEEQQLLTGTESGWFGSLMTVGALLGGPLGGWNLEKCGRRATMKMAAVPFFLGWIAMLSATGPEALFLGRFLCGLGSGLVTVCVPVYVAEISTSALRGTLGAGVQLSITIGILAAYASGLSLTWSNMAVVGLVLSIVQLVASFLVPETPRWLLMNSTKVEAVRALQQLRHQHADCEDECRDIEEGLDTKETFSWSEFKKPELSKPLMISVIIMIFQQFSGINAVMFYTVSIFKNAGLENSEMATVLIGAVQVVGTFVACMLMDKMGRRKLLITAGSVMSISCFLFSWYYYKVNTGSSASSMGMLAVTSLVLYIIGFSLGWGPIPMLIMSEIFPSRVRGAASAIAIFTNWSCAFIVTKEFLMIQDWLGPAITFSLFACSCMFSVLYVWKKVPETKGKSLEDIELFFLGKSMMHV
ncbi:solute carrier family 2, facilitated glucose transporter member 8-like [Mya arenaria]|uniref:solute carrier family 2, facilitated glucose transporter member 8-like n=1 Tax=Mya arenaria TaxID=6604 RepID=UPI0022DFC47D|nr:solute carrier family 2, facilitated glucose transporter member 8-like [Mya arenaria]XP_052773541.1 solute carrier family 2, facilitated glucose transporter member 8-like [Mya arenaria]